MTTPLPATLSAAEAETLRRVQDWLLQTMPDQVERLILFGSKARGDGHPKSDLDLALVLSEATPEREKCVGEFVVDLMQEGLNITVIVFGHAGLEYQAEIGEPLIRNIAEEGIPLIGEGVIVGKGKPQVVARTFLESAHERLHSTRLLVDGGQWRDAVSRPYYAVLAAADGALGAMSITPKSHAGTLNLFSLHLVKPGKVAPRYARLLDEIQRARMNADYYLMKPVTEDEARWALERAEDFVAMVEALLPELQSPASPAGP